jgi:tetratricopeptide (TPR) repeat protein
LAYAYLVKGSIENIDNKLEKAVQSLLQSEKRALKTKDYHLQSVIYSYLSNLYRKFGDYDNQLIFAKKSLEKANLSFIKNSDVASAYMFIANAYVSMYGDYMYNDKTKKQTVFDLAIQNFQKCIDYSQNASAYRKSNITESYYGIATIYFWKDHVENRAIICKNLDLTEDYLKKYPNPIFYCKTKIFRSHYLLVDKKFEEAKSLLQEVNKMYDFIRDDTKILNVFSYYNALLYRQTGNYKESVNWYNDVIVTYQMLYNTNRNIDVKKAEARYINKTKILELKQAKIENKYQQNLTYFGFALAIIATLGLFFLYRYYKSRQREQLFKQELL